MQFQGDRENMNEVLPAGFWRGAGIPKGERTNQFIECGCCGAYHRADFQGDCREDSERYNELPPNAELVEDPLTKD